MALTYIVGFWAVVGFSLWLALRYRAQLQPSAPRLDLRPAISTAGRLRRMATEFALYLIVSMAAAFFAGLLLGFRAEAVGALTGQFAKIGFWIWVGRRIWCAFHDR